MKRISVVLTIAALGAMLAGCTTTREPERVIQPAPPYGEIVERYNDRVSQLGRLHARAVAAVDGTDAEGRRLKEQAEGYLLIERPDRLALMLGKLGDTNLYLGANAESYWWFDMVSEEKLALVGRHDAITRRKTDALGLPVRPLDLIELSGLTPLPEAGGTTARDARGNLVVTTSLPRGTKVMTLEPRSLRPISITLLDLSGEEAVTAELGQYAPVTVEGDGAARPRTATRVVARPAGFDAEIRLTLYEPKNRSLNARAFDVDRLIRIYRFADDEVVDLDEVLPPPVGVVVPAP